MGRMPNGKNKAAPTTLVVSTMPGPMARAHAILVVLAGVDTGRVISLDRGGENTFGRSESAAHRFDDASVSGLHSRIVRAGPEIILIDEESTNGTYVNSEKVKSRALADGDRVQLGSGTFLRFSLVDATEKEALIKVYEAAFRDGLTGIFNRKHLEERIDAELAFALRHGTELSLIILDVDHFKKVNDTYGHPAGDAVLKSAAGVLARGLRIEDVIARYGGEEFVVLTRGIALSGAALLANRLRHAVFESSVMHDGNLLKVTASGGVASLVCCGTDRTKANLLATADARLYKAKNGGRNCIVDS
jgi:two-component system cell cycle response regulator